ncbi:GIY-YIG nuclease family protein [Rathayibacter sp. VKM Ac-2630]|uniref:GIY-YIG nuclease family protein n=1 Tax=Rathayibacter sp. VKM Ac-2630 TaxID=1938617 RepID=UPI0009809F66|nr:GIY-YIG nuclease family protein [Rathayibacter sp. VKM Ac-2630]OOB91113.1 hypothetical protein B0T42_08085 [Rathayibacter sp. VKM Ac-2630]
MVDVAPSALSFLRYDMSEAGSAASLFTGSGTGALCGIYVLEFENGQRYVGQTTNIVSRYASHRRHHGDVVAFRFAKCPRARLDEEERAEIRRQEQTHGLRNLTLTGWPGGTGDRAATVEEGKSVLLPWERDRRGKIGEEGASTLPGRFWELARRDDYAVLSEYLAYYVSETIADPFGTQKVLWVLSALPSTKRSRTSRRLFTFSCGILETVFAVEYVEDGVTDVAVRVNVDAPTFDEAVRALGPLPDVFYDREDASYKSAEVASFVFGSWNEFADALEYPPFLEAAYKLNTTMMRRGSSPLRRHHNSFFADDVLRVAATLDSPAGMATEPPQ